MGFLFKDADDKPVDPKAARMRATLFSVPIALFGLFALVLLLHDGLHGGLDRQKTMGLLSAPIVCAGFIMLIFAVTSKKEAMKIKPQKSAIDEEKPWLGRKDWANGRIGSSSRKAVLLLWIVVTFWCLGSAAISLVVVPQQLQQGNRVALIALVFPAIGLAILYFALNTTAAWRKFNRSYFQMAAFPAASGGSLTGTIHISARLQPRHGLHLRVTCIRRATTGASNNPQTSEKILWQDEKWLRSGRPQSGQNATEIPVFFKLPDNLPVSAVAKGDGIHWKLEASARLHGPNFDAVFEVPVFKLPETPVVPEDPTLPYQLSLDEMRQQIRSQVQVNDLPENGKEFLFPAARNPGYATGASIICAIWTGAIAVLVLKGAPLPLPLVFGAIDLLMAAFVFDLWFRRSRVAVDSKGVTVERAWFSIKKEQRLQAGEIKSIACDIGATAGHAVYHDLKIQVRNGKDFILAKNLSSKPEADWLARQMAAALKQPA